MENVRFAVMTDLHHEHVPDGFQRLEKFIMRAKLQEVDFIIQLGDFCYPIEENNKLLRLFNYFKKPYYHLIGNHDTDRFTKKEMMRWLSMESDYYSFVCKGVKFIIVDANYCKYGEKAVPYSKVNYKISGGEYPYIPEDEMLWLNYEIANSNHPIIIFSHHSLENTFRNRGVTNRLEVQNIIKYQTSKGKKILACINGHDHTDSIEKINSTYYYTLNSISYKWFGFESFPFSDDIHSKYPYLKDIILNEEALSAIIEINDNNINICGMKGQYQNFVPKDVGITVWDGREVTADITSRQLVYI